MLALLTIGTSTNRVNLLDNCGFCIEDWSPVALDHQGMWQESPLADGGRQLDYKNVDIIDTFRLKLKHSSQDEAIGATRDLRRILRYGIDYWKPANQWNEPVYLEAQAQLETNPRYAIVKDGRLPADGNPYAQPFMHIAGGAVMEDLSLVVRHGPWLEKPPGESECVEISGDQDYGVIVSTVWTGNPAAAADDAWAISWSGNANLTNTGVYLGRNPITGNEVNSGVRFPNVNVPQGATILYSYIGFEALFSDSAVNTRVFIWGNDVDSAAQFTTGQELRARIKTTAGVHWAGSSVYSTIDPWIAGQSYKTPNLSRIIQEIVDRPGWAAGQAMAILFDNDPSGCSVCGRRGCSWDHPTGNAPILYILYATTDYSFGRAETCNEEVYISNHNARANISDVYQYDNVGGWSANLIGTYPYTLWVNALTNNDVCVFGCDTSLFDSGPFPSLIFDTDAVLTYTGSPTIDWQYWNGAWVNLTVQDNTDAGGQGPFTLTGVNSVHWQQPSDWVAVDLSTTGLPGAAPAVTGFWIRAQVTIAGADTITGPVQQQTRDIYSARWNYITAANDQTGGDITALARAVLFNQSGAKDSTPPLDFDRAILGLRSTARGDDFRSFLNVSDEQNMPGVMTLTGVGAFSDDPTAPTGRSYSYTFAAPSTGTGLAYIVLQDPLAGQYVGQFRLFLRVVRSGVADTLAMSVRTSIGGLTTYLKISDYVTVYASGERVILDMGLFSFPQIDSYSGSDAEDIDIIYISIRGSSTGGVGTIKIYDLALIPVDECAVEIIAPTRGTTVSGLCGTSLTVDSVVNQKRALTALRRDIDAGYGITTKWLTVGRGPLVWQPEEEQRWHILTMRVGPPLNNELSDPEVTSTIQMYRNNRYMSMRGAG